MPSVFELVLVAEIPLLTDKIKCHGILNNWKIFFRIPGEVERKIKSYTFRIKSPLLPPEITEDNVDFTPKGMVLAKNFAFDFSYYI